MNTVRGGNCDDGNRSRLDMTVFMGSGLMAAPCPGMTPRSVRNKHAPAEPSIQPAGEGLDRLALGHEAIGRRVRIGLADGDAADHDLVVGNRELAPDDRVELREDRLRAVIEP